MTKRLLGWLVGFVILFALLNLPWFELDRAFGAGVSWLADAAALQLSETVRVRWLDVADASGSGDLVIDVVDAVTGLTMRFPVALRRHAFVPVSMFVALGVASNAWRRRRGKLIGLGAFALLLVLLVSFNVVRVVTQLASLQRIDLPKPVANLLVTYFLMATPPNMTFVLPVLLWAGWIYITGHGPRAGGPATVAA